MPQLEVPDFLFDIPDALEPVRAPATPEEVSEADAARARFFLPDGPGAYMVDVVRAFRLVRGARRYVEVGSRDKGNIGWLLPHLAPDAHVVDIDLEQIPAAKDRVLQSLGPNQSVTFVEGDSLGEDTLAAVELALGGEKADAIFLDSSPMYSHFLAELKQYWPLLKEGGFLLAHDICWEGNETEKGKAQAAEFIDRHHPLYVVMMNEPVTRFVRRSHQNQPSWGGLGIMIK